MKKALFFSFLALLGSQPILAQKDTEALQKADSLFAADSIEAAYPFYQQVLRQQKVYSPRMLLRMAYVQEGLGHYPAALYYLSLAQARQPRRSTWAKMASLAQRHRLTGYPDSWRQQLRIVFRRYYYRLLQAALLVAVVGGTVLWLRRRERRGWWVAYAAYVLATAAFLNLLRPERSGLVARSRAALMAGPSPGATWLTTAAVGDRLVVLGKQDVWYRVRWQGKDAYIRQHDLLEVQ
ncbi:SH3 domain-containing protein [Hymenobacter defluvii]|uniref:SH3 domain-containing protein n=1 Tax=Hymenobacter defluvii TaxID=2054411 RepID=A0ABS3TB88_9BACT|nr:SH3 domain-containing protein [Hymenobacter defluvii]MBO3270593.1 SH3 domain-containing protein [Hymenobacter defluvii]